MPAGDADGLPGEVEVRAGVEAGVDEVLVDLLRGGGDAPGGARIGKLREGPRPIVSPAPTPDRAAARATPGPARTCPKGPPTSRTDVTPMRSICSRSSREEATERCVSGGAPTSKSGKSRVLECG